MNKQVLGIGALLLIMVLAGMILLGCTAAEKQVAEDAAINIIEDVIDAKTGVDLDLNGDGK